MTKEEYKKLKKDLEASNKLHLNKLARKYAFSNNKVGIGDIISDHIHKIRVDKIKFTIGGNCISTLPECVYYGPRLKKNDDPFVNGDRETIWQSNIVESI